MRVSTVHWARGILKRFKLSPQIKKFISIELKLPQNVKALRNICVPNFGNKKHSRVKK